MKDSSVTRVNIAPAFSGNADLLLFDVDIEVVPCHALHHQMSSGVSCREQLVYDIERLKWGFPAVPAKVILIDVDQ